MKMRAVWETWKVNILEDEVRIDSENLLLLLITLVENGKFDLLLTASVYSHKKHWKSV